MTTAPDAGRKESTEMSRRISRLCAIALTAVFLFTAPAAFAAGFGDVAFELPNIASLWDWMSSIWSSDAASEGSEVETDLELRAEQGGFTDPLGNEDTPPPPSSTTRSMTGTFPAAGAAPTEP